MTIRYLAPTGLHFNFFFFPSRFTHPPERMAGSGEATRVTNSNANPVSTTGATVQINDVFLCEDIL